MALSDDESATLKRLKDRLDAEKGTLEVLDRRYEGTERLKALGIAVPPNLSAFETIINWSRVTVDTVENRLDVEGFRLPSSQEADKQLWEIWQANNLDEESQLGHIDALALSRSYVTVGSNDDEKALPIVAVESPLEMIHEVDPRTRQVTAAARVYEDPGPFGSGTSKAVYATLYLPDVTIWLESTSGTGNRWVEVDRDEHRLGVVPVVPLVNRPRTGRRLGVSEMRDVIPLADAASRALTNAQVATEVAAIPQRHVAGVSKGDFVDKQGNPLPVWETYFGSVWATQNPDARFGQFSAAELSNFDSIVNLYAHLVASVTGIPVRYFGENTANPPSADGIRADESRLVKNAERKQRVFGGSWEQVNRIVRRIIDGDWDPGLRQMETLWRNPATPTDAEAADAAVKKFQAGIVSLRQIREDLGYSQGQIDRMEMDDARDTARQFGELPAAPVIGAAAAGVSDVTGQDLQDAAAGR